LSGNTTAFQQDLLEIPEKVEFQVQSPTADTITSTLNALTALVNLQFHITQSTSNPKPISKVLINLFSATQIVDVKTVSTTPSYDIKAV
jgi:hypothetical protein